jgi:hypothetical protein
MIQRADFLSCWHVMMRALTSRPLHSRTVVSLAGAVWAMLLLVAGCSSSSNSPKQLVNEGRYDEAIELCTQSIAADPNDPQAYLYRGRAHHCRNAPGDVERAISDFSESIRLAPNEPEAYYSRALAYRDSGEPEKSAADDKAARDLDKRLQEVYAQMPVAPTPPAAGEATEPPAAAKDEPAGATPKAEEPLVGRGMRGLGEPRRDRPEAASSGGSAAPDSAELGNRAGGGAGLGSGRRPDATRQPSFGTRSRTTENNREEDLLADDELGQSIRSPLGRTSPMVPGLVDERARGRGRNPPDVPADPPQRGVGPQFRRPLQSPFPQRAPRPTGFVEEVPQTPIRPPRQATSPYSVPTVHPPGAYQFDYNP